MTNVAALMLTPKWRAILRQHRRHHAVAERDDRVGRDQHPDFPRKLLAWRGGVPSAEQSPSATELTR